jgi:IPT/TIG domain
MSVGGGGRLNLLRVIAVVALGLSLLGSLSCGGGGAGPSGPAAPVISSISPATINATASSTNITVNGSNFLSGSTVNLDTLQLATQFVSSTQLTATVPAAPEITAGVHNVTVVNPSPSGGQSAPVPLTITPTLVGVTPQQGIVGSTISVSVYGGDVKNLGSDVLTFTQAGRTFKTAASSVTTAGPAVVLSVTVPTGLVPATVEANLAAPSTISIAVNSVTSASTLPFEVQPPAHATEILPSSAEQGTTLAVTLVGSFTGFDSSTTLSGDDPGLVFSNVSVQTPGLITATLGVSGSVPAGDHVLTATSGTTPIGFHFMVLPASAATVTLSTLSTASAPPLAAITLLGSGFSGGGQSNNSVVIRYSFGTAAAQFAAQPKSDTQIDTLVPSLPDTQTGNFYTGPVNVQVIANGKASNVLAFDMLALPPNTGAVGATTTAYLDMLSTRLSNERTALDSLGGVPADLAATLDSFLNATASALTNLRNQVTTAASGGTGTLPDGSTFSKDDVDTLDRLLQSANVPSSGIAGATRTSRLASQDPSGTQPSDTAEAQDGAQCSLTEQTGTIASGIGCAASLACLAVAGPACFAAQILWVASLTAKLLETDCENEPIFLSSVSFAPTPALLVVGGTGITETPTGTFSPLPSVVGQAGVVNSLTDLIVRLLSKIVPCLGFFLQVTGVQKFFDSIITNVVDSTGAGSAVAGSVPSVSLTTATVSLLPNPNPLVSISGLTMTPDSMAGSTSLYLDLSQFLLLDPSGISTTDSTKVSGNNLPATIATLVTVLPGTASLDLGTQAQFTATVLGAANQSVTWGVDGVVGGNATVGTISSSGLYTAPVTAGTHTITATSNFDGSAGAATVTVLNQVAVPVLTDVEPRLLTIGPFSLTLTGVGFVPGAQVFFGSSSLTTTFVSPTQLTATGTASTSQLGVVPVSVQNPGTAASNSIDIAVVASSGSSSGSTAVIVGTVGGQLVDKGYVPVPSAQSIAVLNLDATSSTGALVTTIPMPAGYSPNATAADQALLQVVVISYNSPDVQVIDASQDKLIATLTSPVTQFASFSGGNCMVCGVAVDPSSGIAIFDTAQGYLTLDLSTRTFSPSFIAVPAGENFAYNANTRFVLNPTYGTSLFTGLQAIHIPDGSFFDYSASVGNNPDAAAVDLNTDIAAVPDEFTGNQYLINLEAATFDSSTTPPSFSAPATLFPINFTDCGAELNDWSLVSAESSSHLLFLGTEFADCAAVETLPTGTLSGAPPAPAVFQWGHVPASPDGFAWENGGDPHGIAVFTSVVSGKVYGFVINFNATWVARIDLSGVESAPPLAGGATGEVDLTPYVVFFATQ